MRVRRVLMTVLSAVLGVGPAFVAAADPLPDYQPVAGTSGDLIVCGSGTMERFVAPLVAEFVKVNPDVHKEVVLNGSSHVPRQLGDRPNVGVMSRAMTDDEKKAYHDRTGHDPVQMVLAHDAILILVNAKNPVTGLTLPQLDAVYGTERRQKLDGPAASWADLGLTGDYAGKPLTPYGLLEEGQGTVETMRALVLLGGAINRDVHNIPLPENEWGQAVAADETGISYNVYHTVADGAKAVPLAKAAGDAFVAATAGTIADGTYPLVRDLYLYVDTADQPAAVFEFVRFCNSAQGQAVVAAHDAVAISADRAKTEAAKVTARP